MALPKTTENPYAVAGRERKASALIDALDAHGWTALVHQMEPIHWETVAKSAGVNPPSQDTIQLVRDRINQRWTQAVYPPKAITEGGDQ